jgi:asparagine synthase (glutamine-hydrolysing)
VCGIAGVLDLRAGLPSSEALVARMTDVLAHRGPDDAGLLVDPPALLGHRRLAILDLSPSGRQPMAGADESLWITYNGEIYNYVELGHELQLRGHRFRSRCDTEVLLAAYAEWGAGCLERLNGMFAFAIWDRRRRRLFCARDRFGVKPFYYAVAQERFRFASEIKALVIDPEVPRRPNRDRVVDFLAHGLADHTPETMFEGIFQLPPGPFLLVEPDRGTVGPVRRWYEPDPDDADGVPPEALVRARLVDAVSLRLRSDVRVGTCLSGGLDSSSILAIAAGLREQESLPAPDSFSARSHDPRVDEGSFVAVAAAAARSRNFSVVPDSGDVLDYLDSVIWHMDEPFHSGSVLGQWKVMELARHEGTIVLLDGQGGDEVFAGYHYMYPALFYSLVGRGHVPTAVGEALARRRVHGVSLRRSAEDVLKLLLPTSLRARSTPSWLLDDITISDSVLAGRTIRAHQLHALQVSPLPAYLHHEDRNSMSFAIEARVPYLDYRVVEGALGMDARALLHRGMTKWPLREAMRGIVPAEILQRSDKQGFTVDEAQWFRGSLGDELAAAVRSAGSGLESLVDSGRVLAGLAAHLAGADIAPELWRLLTLERWYRLFIDSRELVAPRVAPGAPRTAHRAADCVVRLSREGQPSIR